MLKYLNFLVPGLAAFLFTSTSLTGYYHLYLDDFVIIYDSDNRYVTVESTNLKNVRCGNGRNWGWIKGSRVSIDMPTFKELGGEVWINGQCNLWVGRDFIEQSILQQKNIRANAAKNYDLSQLLQVLGAVPKDQARYEILLGNITQHQLDYDSFYSLVKTFLNKSFIAKVLLTEGNFSSVNDIAAIIKDISDGQILFRDLALVKLADTMAIKYKDLDLALILFKQIRKDKYKVYALEVFKDGGVHIQSGHAVEMIQAIESGSTKVKGMNILGSQIGLSKEEVDSAVKAIKKDKKEGMEALDKFGKNKANSPEEI